MDDSAILFTPSAERLAATNAWAFLHWLRTTQGAELADWQALLEWASEQPSAARRAIRGFLGKEGVAEVELPQLAELLLFLDVRPDDRLLVADAQEFPWGALEHTGATMTRYAGAPAAVLEAAADSGATILAVPAPWLDTGSFQRRQRLDLRHLRTILTLGGPLSVEAAGRIYAWVKPNVMLLGRAGDRVWGDPIGPVRAKNGYTPALASLLKVTRRF